MTRWVVVGGTRLPTRLPLLVLGPEDCFQSHCNWSGLELVLFETFLAIFDGWCSVLTNQGSLMMELYLQKKKISHSVGSRNWDHASFLSKGEIVSE